MFFSYRWMSRFNLLASKVMTEILFFNLDGKAFCKMYFSRKYSDNLKLYFWLRLSGGPSCAKKPCHFKTKSWLCNSEALIRNWVIFISCVRWKYRSTCGPRECNSMLRRRKNSRKNCRTSVLAIRFLNIGIQQSDRVQITQYSDSLLGYCTWPPWFLFDCSVSDHGLK